MLKLSCPLVLSLSLCDPCMLLSLLRWACLYVLLLVVAFAIVLFSAYSAADGPSVSLFLFIL